MWMSTATGLVRFDPSESKPKFRFFDQNQLQGIEFVPHAYYLDTTSEQMFFGGAHGLNVFRPHSIPSDTTQPKLVLSTYTRQRRSEEETKTFFDPFIQKKKKIKLDHLDEVVSFTFSDFNYYGSNQNNYEYQLEGLNEQWIPLQKSNTMTFIDLPAGSYRLKMRGRTLAGNTIDIQQLLAIQVFPPWWNSTLAYCIYFLLLSSLLYRFYHFQLNRQLEQQESQRLTASLAQLKEKNEQIVRAQQQIIQQEKLASLGQLTAGIAHELKNPLNFVINFAQGNKELLEELNLLLPAFQKNKPSQEIEEIMEELNQNAEDIEIQGKRASLIIQEMMNHAGSKPQKEPEIVDLNNLIVNNLNFAYHGFRVKHPQFHVQLNQDLDESITSFKVFPQEFSRVLLNLFTNAFYAIHQKRTIANSNFTPSLLVKSKHVDKGVEIIVRDNGIGISKQNQEKIFDPFFTTKPPGSGNIGLGLSICYDIVVKKHSGTFNVDSEKGLFTAFQIVLPRIIK